MGTSRLNAFLLGLALLCCAAPLMAQRAAGARGSQGYFGIDVRDVNDDEVTALKLRDAKGAEIIRVDHDGPAGKMGLREHDVVTQMNGSPVEGEDQIRHMLHEVAPGRTVVLVILRDGQPITLSALMADKSEVVRQAWEQHLSGPQAPAAGLPTQNPEAASGAAEALPAANPKYSKGFLGTILLTPAYTGAVLERIGPQLSQFFGAAQSTGLLVTSVEANSPAAVAGVRAGDVVVRANAKPVTSMTVWSRAIRDARGQAVAVTILRDKQERMLMLTPEARKHS